MPILEETENLKNHHLYDMVLSVQLGQVEQLSRAERGQLQRHREMIENSIMLQMIADPMRTQLEVSGLKWYCCVQLGKALELKHRDDFNGGHPVPGLDGIVHELDTITLCEELEKLFFFYGEILEQKIASAHC